MDFTFSEQQQIIRQSLERQFVDLCADADIKQLTQQDVAVHQPLWQELVAAGVLGLPFDNCYGGLGLTLVELCQIIELQGKHVAPVPLVASVVETAMSIADSDNNALKERLLPDVIQGKVVLAPVRIYTGIKNVPGLIASAKGDDWELNGQSGFVPYARQANGYLVAAKDEQGADVLFYCDNDRSDITVVAQQAINGEAAGYVCFRQCSLSSKDVVATSEQATSLLALQQQRTWIALAALQVGILDEGLKRTAEYVSQRQQFGRPLGGFQAVSQQAANAYMEIESLRSVYWRALDDVQAGRDFSNSAAVAKYWVCEAGHKVAHTILHLHGGIGQDLDYPIHRYFLWAKQAERYLGNADKVSALLGERLLQSDEHRLEQLCL